MYAEGVAEGKGGGGGESGSEERSKPSRAEPSQFTTQLTFWPIFTVSPHFFPFAPSTEPGPRLCPWHALSDKQHPMFEHLLLHRQKPNSFTSRYIKKPEQGYVFFSINCF